MQWSMPNVMDALHTAQNDVLCDCVVNTTLPVIMTQVKICADVHAKLYFSEIN